MQNREQKEDEKEVQMWVDRYVQRYLHAWELDCLHAQEPTEYSPPADGGEQSSDTVRINATQNTPRLPLAEHSCQPSLI